MSLLPVYLVIFDHRVIITNFLDFADVHRENVVRNVHTTTAVFTAEQKFTAVVSAVAIIMMRTMGCDDPCGRYWEWKGCWVLANIAKNRSMAEILNFMMWWNEATCGNDLSSSLSSRIQAVVGSYGPACIKPREDGRRGLI